MSPTLPLGPLLAALPPSIDGPEAEALIWLQNLSRQQAGLTLAAWRQLPAERRRQLIPLLERAVHYYAAKAARTRAGIGPAGQNHRLMAEFLAAAGA